MATAEELYREALAKNNAIDISGYSNPATFAQAENLFQQMLKRNSFNDQKTMNGNNMMRPSFSITSYTVHLQNVINEMFNRSSKGLDFILTQAALHVLNPDLGRGKIYNPISLFGPPPFFGSLTTTALDIGSPESNPATYQSRLDDKLSSLYKGQEVNINVQPGIPPVSIDIDTRLADGSTFDEAYNKLNIVTEGNTFGKVGAFDADRNTDFKTVVNNGVNVLKPDLTKVFNFKEVGPAFGGSPGGANFYLPSNGARQQLSQKYYQRQAAMSNLDSFFNAEDAENGYLENLLSDDEMYIPFYFQDLRRPDRYLCFRAYLSDLTETITPNWNIEQYYGRIDPVATYMNTERTFSVSFKIVAMSQAGLATMWKKINNFCKMLYPTFENGVLSAAPVVRLRIGDVVADGAGNGLPGFITTPSISYTDSTWEITKFDGEIGKAPMMATINFNYQVIHEKSPHLDIDYNFDTARFRRIGNLNDSFEENNNLQNETAEESEE